MSHTCSFAPDCKDVANIAVLHAPQEVYSCDGHWHKAYLWLRNRKHNNANLGQVAQYYVKKNGSRGKITEGKKWEIEHRKLSPEGVVINEKTGKEAQY
jgi:hypothetical protein